MNATFSVIMPAYNAALFIKESINSVLNQSYPYLELIIVDDGSSDHTIDVINSFEDKRIKVIRQTNQGVATARNRAVSNASNDYIAFLDADDVWSKDKLQNINDHLDSKIGVYYSNVMEFTDNINDAIPSRYSEPIEGFSPKELILIYDFIILSSAVVPAAIFNNIGGFSLDLPGTEDWDLWIRIGKKYQFKKIPSYDCFYRMHENGMSKQGKRFIREEFKVIKKHLIDVKDSKSRVKQLALWVWYKKNFYYHLSRIEILSAFKYFSLMLYSNPWHIANFDFINRSLKKILKSQ